MLEEFEEDIKRIEKIYNRLNCNKDIFIHCLKVAEVAVSIAKRIGNVDIRRVLIGALLHDVGRCFENGIKHGIVGAKIAKEFGFDEKIQRIIKTHIGAGIDKEEAIRLGLPKDDYIPRSIEEKIVCYADKIVFFNNVVPFSRVLKRFKRELGENHPSIKRLLKLHEELTKLINY